MWVGGWVHASGWVGGCVRVCMCVVHLYCSAQLSMFDMEKRYRNKIIIIIIMTLPDGKCAAA